MKWLGILSDSISFSELLTICFAALLQNKNKKYELKDIQPLTFKQSNAEQVVGISFDKITLDYLYHCLNDNHKEQNAEIVRDLIKHSNMVSVGIEAREEVLFRIRETANGYYVDFSTMALSESIITKYLNDYEDIDIIHDNGMEYLCIDVDKNIPLRKIKQLIYSVQ